VPRGHAPSEYAVAVTTLQEGPRVEALAGHELYRFRSTGRLSRTVEDVTKLKKASDGSVTIPDVDVLKTGEFNGLQLVDGDLMAMVERFAALREAVFAPPFRLDHSWSIYDVVGWFDALETYQRVDESDGLAKTFLKAEIRITGSINVEVDAVLSAIKRGALDPRSSELGYYRTNAGTEYPMVFYGAAFVDIPAVEGLGGVKLSKRSEPGRIVNLNATTEGTPAMSQTSTDTSTGTEGAATTATTDAPKDDAATTAATDAATTTAPAADAPVEGETPREAELRKRVAKLRQNEADRNIEHFSKAGVIVKANRDAAVALLSHDDDEVRDLAAKLLQHSSGVVKLDVRAGQQSSTTDAEIKTEGLEMFSDPDRPIDEVAAQWDALTKEERKAHNGEYLKFMKDRQKR
jgi:hypothetical protein